jgi:hypothetical protein
MKLKKGVRTFIGWSEGILKILPIIENVCGEYNIEFVVTSGVEGRHKQDSKHYDGKALDMRSREFNGGSMGDECRSFVEHLQGLLGSTYFILQESHHIHIQYNGN